MNEDYLWDKTGSDPEIEQLETMLATFRGEQRETLALPTQNVSTGSQVVSLSEQPRLNNNKRFSRGVFALAAAACVACAAIGSSLWLQTQPDKYESPRIESAQTVATDASGAAVAQTTAEIEQTIVAAEAAPPPSATRANALKSNKSPKIVAENRAFARRAVAFAPRKLARSNRHSATKTIVTNEERRAYDQLMLALSITNSKLQLVRDKVDGTPAAAIVPSQRNAF